MQSSQVIRELSDLASEREQIGGVLQNLSLRMGNVIDYIDSLDEAREEAITREILVKETHAETDPSGEVVEYTYYPVSDPPIKEGTLTVYLDGSDVDPANYEVDLTAGEIRPLLLVPEGAVVTADYVHRGERADVLDIAKQLEGYALPELHDLRSKYATAIDWIEQNFGVS